MKIKISLLCLLAAFSAWAKPIVIKGKINGKLPDALHYTAPVNGALGLEFCYTETVDANGNFEISVNSAVVTFIDVYYNYQPAGYIVAQPGSTYTLTITESDGKITPLITGADSDMQKRYGTVVNRLREVHFFEVAQEASKIQEPDAFTAFFDSKLKADLTTLGITGSKIPTAAIQPLLCERESFYAAAKSYALAIKHMNTKNGLAPNLMHFQAIWDDIFKKQPAGITQSPWFGYYLQEFKNYKYWQLAGFNEKNIIYEQQVTQAGIQRTASLLPEAYNEYAVAMMLYGYLYGDRKDKGAITVFNYLNEHYPKSGYISYFEPKIAPVISFFAETESLPQGAAYVDNYRQLNSFEELVKKFEGQKLFIDVWATWCGPCRDEFKYKDELYKILKANNITVLYISVDKDDKDETWKKMIGHYGLQGHHIRVNTTLDLNLTKLFNSDGDINNTGILIPWYMLVGSNGTVQQLHAASPSDLTKLETEIKKLQ